MATKHTSNSVSRDPYKLDTLQIFPERCHSTTTEQFPFPSSQTKLTHTTHYHTYSKLHSSSPSLLPCQNPLP